MNRNFWSLLMLIAVIMTGGAGFYLYSQLQERNGVAVPLKSVSPTPTTPPSASTPPEGTNVAASSSTAVSLSSAAASVALSSATVAAPKPKLPPGGKIPTAFAYTGDAKSVYLIGDFTDWMRKPMKKSGNQWALTVPLKPGRYEYMFVVNGKRQKDPQNGSVSEKERSVIDVSVPGSAN